MSMECTLCNIILTITIKKITTFPLKFSTTKCSMTIIDILIELVKKKKRYQCFYEQKIENYSVYKRKSVFHHAFFL